jgi:hypothetical protein
MTNTEANKYQQYVLGSLLEHEGRHLMGALVQSNFHKWADHFTKLINNSCTSSNVNRPFDSGYHTYTIVAAAHADAMHPDRMNRGGGFVHIPEYTSFLVELFKLVCHSTSNSYANPMTVSIVPLIPIALQRAFSKTPMPTPNDLCVDTETTCRGSKKDDPCISTALATLTIQATTGDPNVEEDDTEKDGTEKDERALYDELSKVLTEVLPGVIPEVPPGRILTGGQPAASSTGLSAVSPPASLMLHKKNSTVESKVFSFA